MKEFFTSYIGEFISIVIAGFGGWFFGRAKQNAEVISAEIDNDIKAVGLYKDMLDDLSKRYEKKFNDIVELYSEKERVLREEIVFLRHKNTILEKENKELKKRVLELEKTTTR